MTNRMLTVVALAVLALLLWVSPGRAQLGSGGLSPQMPSASAAAYYYVSKPGELTMQVNVWGEVHQPGRYEVPSSTDLIQLLSYAGGPLQEADLGGVKVTRFLKRETGVSRGEFNVNLQDLSKVEQAKLTLYPGDTVFIDRTGWASARDIFNVVVSSAVITSAIAQIIIVSRNR